MKLLFVLVLLVLLAAGGMSVALRNHDQDRRVSPPRAQQENAPVPEPLTMVMLASGGAFALYKGRRK